FGVKSSYATSDGPLSVAIGDLNGDGKPDLAVGNNGPHSPDTTANTSTVSVLLGNGDGTFGGKADYGTGKTAKVGIGELNGDGKPDLAVANVGDGTVSVLLGAGDGTFAVQTTYSTGDFSNPYSVAVGDLNHDGRLDLAVANNSPSTVSVLLGNGDGTFGIKRDYLTGREPSSVAIVDLNGDGKPDLV